MIWQMLFKKHLPNHFSVSSVNSVVNFLRFKSFECKGQHKQRQNGTDNNSSSG